MAQSVNSLLGIFQGFQGNKGRQAVGCILGPVCQIAIQVQWGLSRSKNPRPAAVTFLEFQVAKLFLKRSNVRTSKTPEI